MAVLGELPVPAEIQSTHSILVTKKISPGVILLLTEGPSVGKCRVYLQRERHIGTPPRVGEIDLPKKSWQAMSRVREKWVCVYNLITGRKTSKKNKPIQLLLNVKSKTTRRKTASCPKDLPSAWLNEHNTAWRALSFCVMPRPLSPVTQRTRPQMDPEPTRSCTPFSPRSAAASTTWPIWARRCPTVHRQTSKHNTFNTGLQLNVAPSQTGGWDRNCTRKKLVQTVGNAEMTQWPLRLDDLSLRNIWVQGSIHLPHRFRAHMMTPALQQSTFSVYLAEAWHNGLIAFGQQIDKNKTYPVRTHAPWNIQYLLWHITFLLRCYDSNV